MERSRSFFCMVGLMAFCLAGHAFVCSRFGSNREPARAGYDVKPGNASKLFDEASSLLWSATGQALSVGAALGMVFAVTQASVRAEEMPTFGDLESQVTVAAITRIDKDKKVKELKADAKKVDEFTKTKVRTSEEKFREFTKDLDTEFSSTERSIRAGPGVRSVYRKSLQKAKPAGPTFTGFEGLPALPALPSLSLPGLPGLPGPGGDGGGAPAATEDAALGVLSGAAISLGIPAVVVAGAVNNRIQEKKREDAERRAREAADVTGPILTAVAGVGAAVLVGNAILTNLPEAEEFVEEAETETVDTTAAQKAAAEAAAKAKAAAEKVAAEKAAAAKAAADKAAAEKAAADKATADKASADKASADKAAADKAAADKAAADKAAAAKAAAEKAAAEKAAADKAAAEKAAAEKAAAAKAAAEKAAAEKAAADKAAAQKAAEKPVEKVETTSSEETTTSKIAKKGGYFAYMKEKQRLQSQ